jgi:hypothetical protein
VLGQEVAAIRAGQQRYLVQAVLRKRGDPEADREVQRRVAGELGGLDVIDEPYREPQPVRAAGFRQQDHELVAAVAEEHVVLAQEVADRLGEPAEDVVAAQVAVHVIDGLEEVDVEQTERQHAAGPVGARDLLVDPPLHRGAAESAGEGIDEARVGRRVARPTHESNSTSGRSGISIFRANGRAGPPVPAPPVVGQPADINDHQ